MPGFSPRHKSCKSHLKAKQTVLAAFQQALASTHRLKLWAEAGDGGEAVDEEVADPHPQLPAHPAVGVLVKGIVVQAAPRLEQAGQALVGGGRQPWKHGEPADEEVGRGVGAELVDQAVLLHRRQPELVGGLVGGDELGGRLQEKWDT